MQMDITRRDDVAVFHLRERRLDACAAGDFKDQIIDFIDEGNHRLVLDMSEVDFVDSSGLGAMVSVLKRVGLDGDLVVCGVCEAVMRMFRLARMDKIFSLVGSEDEALVAING